MKTQSLPLNYDAISPAGAEVRRLLSNQFGGIAHCTLAKGKITKAVQHKTVSEFWHILAGKGAIWRKDLNNEMITPLEAGMTIDIPVGTQFQYRSDEEDLVFICVTMPAWPGAEEARIVEQGIWITKDYK